MSDTTASSSASPPEPHAQVRVFLPTFRRRDLLPRAVRSLLDQTMPDWICELHNDDPDDAFPGELVRSLGDPRFRLHRHARNLGPTATFNLFFGSTPEPFSTILEDDNWWEPQFLQTMLDAARQYPAATVLWANMRVWQQQPDGNFSDTGRLLHPYREGDPPRLIPWGHPQQMTGAIHSNGAALVRSRPGQNFAIPEVPFAVIEMFRERAFPHPLILIPRPLAHYCLTLASARSDDRAEWASLQAMLTGTFLKYAHYGEGRLAAVWAAARAENPPTTTILLFASFVEPSCRSLRRYARWRDWVLLARGIIWRPSVLWRVLAGRRRHGDWWDFLEQNTRKRFAEAAGSP
jgi:glycosyltransferase involved in cell wall biosynthesis